MKNKIRSAFPLQSGEVLKKLRSHLLSLGIGFLSLMSLAAFVRDVQAQTPYWDVSSPGNPGADVGSMVAKDGVVYATVFPVNGGEYITRWTMCDGWQTIGECSSSAGTIFGSDTLPKPIYINGDYLYLGGNFDRVHFSVPHPGGAVPGQITATNIAKYNLTTGTWSAVGDNTMTYVVNAIAVDANGKVYVGTPGLNVADDSSLNPPVDTALVQVWNGSSWSTLGGGLAIDRDPTNVKYQIGITSLVSDGTSVFVAGEINGAYNGSSFVSSPALIKWNGSAWVAMDTAGLFEYLAHDAFVSYNSRINSMAISGTNLFAVGNNTGPKNLMTDAYTAPYGLVRFSTVTGAYIPDYSLMYVEALELGGFGNQVVSQGGMVYVAGSFQSVTNGSVSVSAHSIARWNGTSWSALGSGLELSSAVAQVKALAVDGYAVYATGLFDTAGGASCDNGNPVRWVLQDYPRPCNATLNVNFGGDDTDKIGFAATGQTSSDYWNGYNQLNQSPVAMINLLWSDSSSSGAGLTMTGAYGNGGLTTDDGMYDTYVSNYENPITITLTNLPTGKFDFYLYGHGEANNQNGVFGLASGANDYGTQSTTVVGSDSWTSASWVNGLQYVVFGGVDITVNQPVTITVYPGTSGFSVINGLQIIPHKDPTDIYGLINVDFGQFGGSTNGVAAVGFDASDCWNVSASATKASHNVSNLVWSDASGSSVGLTINNASGLWGNSIIGNDVYDTYAYSASTSVTITVTNLAAGSYDFYLYGHGPADDANSIFNLTSNSIDYGTKATTTVGSDSWSTVNWTEGKQYIVFRGVAVAAGQPVTVTVPLDALGYAIINSMQIVVHAP